MVATRYYAFFFFFGLENAIYHAIRVIMQFSNAVTSPAQPVQSLQFRMRYAFYMSIRFGALLSLGVIVIGELRACVRVR